MAGKYVFGGSINVGVIGDNHGGVVTVGGPGDTIGPASVSPMQLKDGDSVSLCGETIEGPCTVEVRHGVLYVDGKARSDKDKRIEVAITIKSKLAQPLTVTSGKVVLEEGTSGDIHVDSGQVTVHGSATNIKVNQGQVTVTGNVGTLTSTMGTVKIGGKVSKVQGSVMYM